MKINDQKIDLVVSFDTTGSMYPVLTQVRRNVEEFVKEMFGDFGDLRLGIIAHGDYCDKDNPYTIKAMDLTRDEEKLSQFVRDVEPTYGGDNPECYELVLNTVREQLSWRKDSKKILMLIGDANPHEPSYHLNERRLDWRVEAEKIAKEGIEIFSVHALAYYRNSSREFYKHIAELTGGVYLTLDHFNETVELIKATCYQQAGEERLNEYVTIIKDNGKLTRSLDNNIRRLLGEEIKDDYEETRYSPRARRTAVSGKGLASTDLKEMGDMVPVMPGRFQAMEVDKDEPIREFIRENGIEFQKGRGFYELTKGVKVQQYKEIIMQDKETGEMFTGAQVRERLGLLPQSNSGGKTESLRGKGIEGFRVYIQSTSYNRKLLAGTVLLYEVSDFEDTGEALDVPEEVKKDREEIEVAPETKKKTPKKKAEPKEKEEPKEKKKPEKKKATKSKVKDKERIIEEVKEETIDTPEFEELGELEFKVVEKEVRVPKKLVIKKEKKESKQEKKLAEQAIKEKKALEKKAKSLEIKREKEVERYKAQIEKVKDGLTRVDTSRNKKNRTYLENNLKRIIEYSEKMLEDLED